VDNPKLVHEHFYDDEFAIIASTRHRLGGRKWITLSDLHAERWASVSQSDMWPKLQRAFEASRLSPPDITLDVAATLPMLQVVAASQLLGFASKEVLRQAQARLRVVELRVKGLKWKRSVGLSYRDNAYLSPAAINFIELARATAKTLEQG
jgi:DNA-binding transcriptional LysR family regulator